MIDALLAGFSAVLAVVYLQLGRVVLTRRPEGSGRLAAMSFATWWFMLGAVTAAAVIDYAIRNTIHWTLASYLAYLQILVMVIVIAVAALLYYLVFLFTGRREAWRWIAGAYFAFYAVILYYLAILEPVAVIEGEYATTLRYANDLTDSPLATAIGVLLVAPPLLAAVGYFSLYFRVDQRSQKFRIGSISGAFIVWFGSSLLIGQLTDWSDTLAWDIASQAIALGASVLIYIAFRPPAWVQRRFDVHGFGERTE